MILLSVDHPNIVKLYEIYLDHQYLHLVTELLEGGPISPESKPEKRYTEIEAARIIR
jgi:calcium-dependent protein kinase